MRCEVEYTDEFERWWNDLDEDAQVAVDAYVTLLEEHGVGLGFPHSSDIKGASTTQMRELRPVYKGKPYRVLYAFDPRRMAILLLGGDKTGDPNWYKKFVPLADSLYREHLDKLEKEGLIDG
jgi:hypothetical protein